MKDDGFDVVVGLDSFTLWFPPAVLNGLIRRDMGKEEVENVVNIIIRRCEKFDK